MNLLQESRAKGYSIHRCGEGQIQIGDVTYSESLLLTPDQINPTWGPSDPSELQQHHFEQILALEPEVVLLGTGHKRLMFTTPEQQRWLQLFPGMEVMETGAACRTYNLLHSEGRRVVAALILENPY